MKSTTIIFGNRKAVTDRGSNSVLVLQDIVRLCLTYWSADRSDSLCSPRNHMRSSTAIRINVTVAL